VSPFQVSVVIPAHNGLPDVLEAVGSALSQTRPPLEVVVVDDRSTDGTADAVERAFGDTAAGGPGEVRVLRGSFGSAGAARNAGWRAARGEWVAFLDADDLWFDGKLAAAAETLAAAPEAIWFFSDGAFRTLEGETRLSWLEPYAELPEHWVGRPVGELIEVNFVLTSSVLVKREALEAVSGFDESLSHAEDIDLWIRLARRGDAAASRRALVRYQHREGGLTRQIEARLNGDVVLFERLAADPLLPDAQREAARRRAALSHFKLGVSAVREGRRSEARGHFAAASSLPEKRIAAALGTLATLLPQVVLARLRRQGWATGAAASMKRVRRVVLRDARNAAAAAPRAESRAASGRRP